MTKREDAPELWDAAVEARGLLAAILVTRSMNEKRFTEDQYDLIEEVLKKLRASQGLGDKPTVIEQSIETKPKVESCWPWRTDLENMPTDPKDEVHIYCGAVGGIGWAVRRGNDQKLGDTWCNDIGAVVAFHHQVTHWMPVEKAP